MYNNDILSTLLLNHFQNSPVTSIGSGGLVFPNHTLGMVSNQSFNGPASFTNNEAEVKSVKEKAGGVLAVFRGNADEDIEY